MFEGVRGCIRVLLKERVMNDNHASILVYICVYDIDLVL